MPESSYFETFQTVFEALEPIDDEARHRVLTAVATLLDIHLYGQPVRQDAGPETDGATSYSNTATTSPVVEPSTFAELYSMAQPKTNGEAALVAGYWIQVVQNGEQFSAQGANRELTHLGHRISNITSALSTLIREKPQLVLQVRKGGNSRQARKTYRLSEAGIRRIEEMTQTH